MQVLHLEDSQNDAELIGELLRREWPSCAIRHVTNPRDYHAALGTACYDLILSDYTLPEYDGLSALAAAKAKAPETPFVFLSGTIGEERAVEALKRGATDYIIKDRPIRLISAIRHAFALIDEAKRRREIEERLRQNEERFRQIAENVAELIALIDLHGRRIYVNPAYQTLLGGSQLGADAFHDVHLDDVRRVRAAFADAAKSGTPFFSEYRLLTERGIRHVETHGNAVRDDTGRVINVLMVSRDVTVRRETEARLREQASLLDKAKDAIIATSLDYRVTYWNASAERLYGWTAAEVAGCRLDDIGLEFDRGRFAAARAQLLTSGEWRGDFRLRTKAGETVLIETTWSLVAETSGRPGSILYIDTDVTERKKLETQLLRAQRMESIGTLAGGIAHDLNNVLTPVLLSIDMLASKVPTDEDRLLVEKTRASASHGAALVQQLLAFARGGEARRTKVDVAAALEALAGLVRQTLPRTIQLDVQAPATLWAISADTTQFNQVLINLCINARDAMPLGGEIRIRCQNVVIDAEVARANPGTQPGRFLRLSVADTGTGIPATIIERIFDPFFTTKVAGKGSGLGLSMVAGIMKSHGGFVQVQSVVDRGSTFHLHFPVLVESPPVILRSDLLPLRGHGELILVVDDEPLVREMLQIMLERAGYRVVVAPDGGSGVEEFRRKGSEIAVLISDMMLPDISGIEVIHEVRKLRPTVPVIAISGMMASGAFDELLELRPAIECLAKPIPPATLLASVRRALPAVSATT